MHPMLWEACNISYDCIWSNHSFCSPGLQKCLILPQSSKIHIQLKAQEERGASEQERLMSKMLRLKWELQQRRWARSIPHQPATTMSEDASRSGHFQPPPSDYTSSSPDSYSPSHPLPCDTQAKTMNTHDATLRSAQDAMRPPVLPDSTQREQRESWLHSTRLPPKKLGFKRKSTHQSAVINATRVKVMKNPGKFPHPKDEQHLNQQAPLQVSTASNERGPMRSRSSSPESPSSPPSPVPKLMPQNIIKPPRMSYHARLAEAKLRSSRGSPLKLVINAESLQDSCESSASPPPALTHSPLSATPSTSSSTSSSPTLSQHSHESSNPEPCSNLMMPPVMTSLPSFGSRNMLS
ncbi:hypothetical protein MVEG_09540 [Podila verticillata NRRL 6337]|nr:hypothetical protein MVEG_09540 [Podila verticillata NRRL 6337]